MIRLSVLQSLRNFTGISQGKYLLSIRFQSTPAAAASDGQDTEWDSALPYSKIPGPSLWHFLKNYKPGGRYRNVGADKMFQLYRKDFGDLVRFPGILGQEEIVLSFHPEDFEKIFRTEGHSPIRLGFDTFRHYRKEVRPDLFRGLGGLVSEQGENWHQIRSIVNPIMLQPKTVQTYIDKLDEVSWQFLNIMKKCRDGNDEMPSDFYQWMNRWSLETMGVLALDTRFGALDDQESRETETFVKHSRELFDLIYQLDYLPSIWKYYKTPAYYRLIAAYDKVAEIAMSKIDEAIKRMEKNPSASSDNPSILEKLLNINREVATVMAFDLILASVETTLSAIVGILYCLATHPDKQAKLREELRAILPKKDSPLTSENMRNLPYLRATIKEGMRLYSPVFANRRAAGRDIVLQGYQIPKGTQVRMASTIVQQDERFVPRANEFLPERWIKQGGCPINQKMHPFAYLPFGNGPRTCVGRRLAMLEMEILISRITRMFDYRWNYGELQMKTTMVSTPVSELKFQVIEVED